MRDKDRTQLVRAAEHVLANNWTGNYTRPSPRLYPHQWSWDSGFIAIGYSTFDQQKAQSELLSLFAGQWSNGMVPHIVFNPDVSGEYFPGPDFWDSACAAAAPKGAMTSGITQPPVHAIAALIVYQRAGDKANAEDWLRRIYPKLIASHRFFHEERDPLNEGLVYIRHPWESGTDNSPTWDEPLRLIEPENLPDYMREDLDKGVAATQRPTDADYDRYIYLLQLFKKHNYDEVKIFADCPFLIQDTLVNSVLIKADQDLIEIGQILGEDVSEIVGWEAKTRAALAQKLWHDKHGFFDDFDLRAGRLIEVDTAAGFCPLYAGAPSMDQAKELYAYLDSKSFCSMHHASCFSIPNYNMQGADFDPDNYWRGPIWINMNWMLAHALQRYGFDDKAASVRRDIMELVSRFGFHEYFDPIEGKGYGSDNFSWTAALFLDTIFEAEGDSRVRKG